MNSYAWFKSGETFNNALQKKIGVPAHIGVVRVHWNYMQNLVSATFLSVHYKMRTVFVAIGTQARVSTLAEITNLSGDPFKSA